MKKLLVLITLFLTQFLSAQIHHHESEVFVTEKASNPERAETIFIDSKGIKSNHGELLDSIKAPLDIRRKAFLKEHKTASRNKTASSTPALGNGFSTHPQQGVPNDNDMAISNDGLVVSVSNSTISVYDTAGTKLMAKTIKLFCLGNINVNGPYDPHVLYDPQEDKFVLVFLDGYSSGYTKMIVAFSQTKDPTGMWNFYELPGNVHGDNTWSDYPFPALSKDELFISVLLWKNGESGWDSEATNELIWQVDKQKGYDGDSLVYKYYDSIVINGRQVWNTRPVQGGSNLYGPNMYLLANRAIDTINDSIFLFEITNTIASGNAQLNISVLKATEAYGIPPSAIQPDSNNTLRTNYADIHSSFYENDIIQFVGNSIDTSLMAPGIYYGQIKNPSGTQNVTTSIYSLDTLDLNYPSIAYAGNSIWDQSAIINCLHSSDITNPGTSTFYTDGTGGFSDLVRVKHGLGTINSMTSSLERWGDYTGMQRKYNEPGTCWLMGSYGNISGSRPGNWVAAIKNSSTALSINEPKVLKGFKLYPNPVVDLLNFEIVLDKEQMLTFSIVSISGQEILSTKKVLQQGINKVEVNTFTLIDGGYFLNVTNHSGHVLESKKFVVLP